MGGAKLTREEKEEQKRKDEQTLQKYYERITSDPLYDESIFEQYSGKYDSPKKVMYNVKNGKLSLSDGINELKQWIKVLIIITDNSEKQGLHYILERNRDIINKSIKELDKELKNRGLVLKF